MLFRSVFLYGGAPEVFKRRIGKQDLDEWIRRRHGQQQDGVWQERGDNTPCTGLAMSGALSTSLWEQNVAEANVGCNMDVIGSKYAQESIQFLYLRRFSHSIYRRAFEIHNDNDVRLA